MFIISTKNQNKLNYCVTLVDDIRKYHETELICIVDSDSEDKSYFEELRNFKNIVICDVGNKYYCIGAYWYAYNMFPNEEFYYCFHDTLRVKANLDNYKTKDFTTLFSFDRNTLDVEMKKWCTEKLKQIGRAYKAEINDLGIYGPIWMCKNWVMKSMLEQNFNLILPQSKAQLEAMERISGYFFEDLGLNIIDNTLFGDILEAESSIGNSGLYPHKTSWQFPIEKYYGGRK